ncbi:NAD(P)/FAD-dependent oxidoreductase [Vogesella sp. LIG4]|uniref:NAD(P)/FAD-dependent oxidoreductase n=1 Tax=Vogesella sp. LIG4 TaxID=1192162 RepID=UPI00081F7BDA|nr:NAD(P)/FAD-dependent oxidoreductase [Vogesella sp. LIG4]SCK12143.1 L-2-hydroxyglutarate oxidase LhgO [Vogesella sp. LIG4]
MDKVDCVVIGAGVIGLACARLLAASGREVVIVEREAAAGQHCSSRNSEVIHAGIYYRPGSLKARLCVAGKAMLYRYCAERAIAHQRIGKLLLAVTADDLPRLAALQAQAAQNGVTDLRWLDQAGLADCEPALQAHAALLSPSTGIIDSHGLMQALLADTEAGGAQLALASSVQGLRATADGLVLQLADGYELLAGCVINAAGAWAPALAAGWQDVPRETVPTPYYARGVYFALQGRSPFSRLIYPMPEAGGLGTHLTLDLAGQARFGPDVEWIDKVDYTLDPSRGERFYGSIRRWWPQLADGALAPAYCGVRPKIAGPGMADADFLIQDASQHGVPGLINLFGIESPGLTASLAIAEQVAARVLPAG